MIAIRFKLSRKRCEELLKVTRCVPSCMFAIFLVLIVFLLVGATFSQEPPKPTDASEDRLARQEVEVVAKNLVRTIAGGNPDDFLSFCSRRGLFLGIDDTLVALPEIRRQIRGKRGAYCLLFDTGCLRAEPGWEQTYSFRELLSKTKEPELRIHLCLPATDGSRRAEVLEFLKGQPVGQFPIVNPLPFDFVREKKGQWKLAAIPY